MVERKIELSIIIPCFNCERAIGELYTRLRHVLDRMNLSYEIIFINDSSIDQSLSLLKDIADKDKNVIVIDLMFNVGQFRALMCGFEHSSGRYVVTIDDDLQHPPEEIEKLYDYMRDHPEVDAVFGKYIEKKHSLGRNVGSLIVRYLNNKMFKIPKRITISSFRCLKREIVDVLISYKTKIPIISPIIIHSTRHVANVPVRHDERKFGKSNYNIFRLIKVSFDNVINFTSMPLKYISLFGFCISVLSLMFIAIYIFLYAKGYISVPGWLTVVLLINFYSGIIVLSIGIIGEYLARILEEVNGNPPYKIRKIYGK